MNIHMQYYVKRGALLGAGTFGKVVAFTVALGAERSDFALKAMEPDEGGADEMAEFSL